MLKMIAKFIKSLFSKPEKLEPVSVKESFLDIFKSEMQETISHIENLDKDFEEAEKEIQKQIELQNEIINRDGFVKSAVSNKLLFKSRLSELPELREARRKDLLTKLKEQHKNIKDIEGTEFEKSEENGKVRFTPKTELPFMESYLSEIEVESEEIQKAKYIKRTGGPGNYKYFYDEEDSNGLSMNEKEISDAVALYQSTAFDAINNELRYDQPDKYKEKIKLLDQAAKDTTEDTLFRGLGSDFTKEIMNKFNIKDRGNIDELKEKLIGKKITDKGFSSTSKDLAVAADFARDKGTGQTTVMQIDGEKQGIDVSNHLDNNKAKKEKEFVIKRGTSFEITNVAISKKTGKLVLYTKVTDSVKKSEDSSIEISPSRNNMPQLDDTQAFIDYLIGKGCQVERRSLEAHRVLHKQIDLDGAKIDSLAKEYSEGKEYKPVIISSEGFVLDGNHRIAAMKKNGATSIEVDQTDKEFDELRECAFEFLAVPEIKKASKQELKEMVEEHEQLVDVLESDSHEDDKEEAKKQKKELGEYKKKLKKSMRKYIENTEFAKAEYQGKDVELEKPFRLSEGKKKFGVYVKNDKGNVIMVKFGDPNMSIKRDDPESKASFRARHNCDEKKDKTTPGYWSCRFWSGKKVSDLVKSEYEEIQDVIEKATKTKLTGGRWITTDQGHKVYIGRNGEVKAGVVFGEGGEKITPGEKIKPDSDNKRPKEKKVEKKPATGKDTSEEKKKTTTPSDKKKQESGVKRERRDFTDSEDQGIANGYGRGQAIAKRGFEGAANELGISIEEAGDVLAYTSTSLFNNINTGLRKDKGGDVVKFKEQLNATLDKLPKHEGTVHRAAGAWDSIENIIKFFESADSIEEKTFMSTSRDKNIANKGFSGDISYKIKSKTGRDVSKLTEMANEEEVLFKAGTNFKIKKVKPRKLKNGTIIGVDIEMEEI